MSPSYRSRIQFDPQPFVPAASLTIIYLVLTPSLFAQSVPNLGM